MDIVKIKEQIKKAYAKIRATDDSTEEGMNIIHNKINEILGLQAKINPAVLNNAVTTEKFPYVKKEKKCTK